MNCICCGNEINIDTKVYDLPTCRECQKKMFRRFKEDNGAHMAIYFMCGMNNVPCVPKLAADLKGKDIWFQYLDLLAENDRIDEGFWSAVTNFRMIFGRKLTEETFAKYCALLPESGWCIAWGDDERARRVCMNAKCNHLTYGHWVVFRSKF